MVDIIVAPDGHASAYNSQNDWPLPVWVTHLIGYFFYMTDETPENFRFRKTEDGGRTWSAPSAAINNQLVENGEAHAVYYADWTSGITTGIIHVIWTQNNRVVSRLFDPTTDTFTPALGLTPTIVLNNGGAQATHVQIGVIESGELWSAWNATGSPPGNGVRRAPASGSPWTNPGGTNPIETEIGSDVFFLMPARTGDTRDMWLIYFDDSQNQITLKAWDNSITDFLAESAVIRAHNWATVNGAVAQRHSDGHLFLVSFSDVSGVYDLTFTEIVNGTTFTNRTNILTGVTGPFRAGITIDQTTGRIYVAWATTPTSGAGAIEYSFTDDSGVNWSAPVQFSFDSLNRLSLVVASLSVAVGASGRWMPLWWDRTPADWETNFDNSLALGLPAPGPPVPPPPIVPAGGTYGPAAGAPPGTILYITPDGIEYPLVTPHVTGRFVMSFSGFGTAPIQYISQRGPNQDGETVRDFNLTPRVIQLLERQQFKGRGAWWDGRADILNDLRPNRQLTATDVVTGTVRIVTANGDVRDLNVFIQDGPRFEARNVDEWDEWAFEEVLRFIAHDPLWFNPARVDFALAFTLDADLVFPITFDEAVVTDDIIFGDGEIDQSFNLDYVGTWASLPTIVIVGPLDNPIIENVTTGEILSLLRNIGPGRTVTIDLAFGQKTITDDLGNNLLGSLSTTSDLGTWHIAPTPEAPQVVGQPRPTARNVIRLRGSNPTGPTSVQIRYFTRYFGI